MDRQLVLQQPRHPLGDQSVLFLAQAPHPGVTPSRTSVAVSRSGLNPRGEDRAGIADQPEFDVPVAADRPVVHVDLDHGRVLGQSLAVAHPEVERRADDQDHVRLLEGATTGQVEVMGITRSERAAGGAVHVSGDVERAYELGGHVGAAGGPDLAAEQHARPFGVDEDVCQPLDVRRVTDALGRRAVMACLRNHRLFEWHLAV